MLFGCLQDRPTKFDHTTVEPDEVKVSPVPSSQNRHIWQRPNFILEKFGNLEGKILADLGAGSGYFAFRFLKNGAHVIAIDIDQEMIDVMKEESAFFPDSLKKKFEARLATPDKSGLNSAEVDFVFVANTYAYIEHREQYFSNLATCMKKGGKLLIVDFKKKNTPFGPPLESRLALGQVENELISAGYKLIESDDTSLQFQYVIVAEPGL